MCADSENLSRTRHFLVDSAPAGASVLVMGKKLGETPSRLSERDIYPNWYPDASAHLYGTVTLRKTGCDEASKRLTLDDIDSGVFIQLECNQDAKPAESPLANANTTKKLLDSSAKNDSSAKKPVAHPEVLQRRLNQLKVLQELLDDELITAEEERTIRRRVLNRDVERR